MKYFLVILLTILLYSCSPVCAEDWHLISGDVLGEFDGYNWTGSTWQTDAAIGSGLGDVGIDSAPTVFQKSSTWYMIAGSYDGLFHGFNWTGSTWQQDAVINSSLGDVGDRATPYVFQKDSTWYLISGMNSGEFTGYNWTGSTWQQDDVIKSGLVDTGYRSAISVFQKDSTWYLIAGREDGKFDGYNWTGSTWQQDAVINSSLGDISDYSTPTVFQKSSTWYLISGSADGVFYGFNWTGSTWQQDNVIKSGLVDPGSRTFPCAFDMAEAAAGTPDPTNLGNTKGTTWVNHTWNAGSGNVTDSYNVSINGTWHNSSINKYYNNTPITSGNWSNITVWAFNSTYNELSLGNISEDVQTDMIAEAPIITLLSQTPSILYQNSTGNLNISFGIFHNVTGLNNTSISFIFRNYDHTLSDTNHSIRVPANNKCVPWEYDSQIIRGNNRNESLNFENNDTITGGDIYSWSGLDENSTRLTIVPINSTYTIVNINGTVHDLAMEQMWYLDRTAMIESTKTKLAIHKSQDVLIKFWDAEIFKGNYNFIGAGYTDTLLGSTIPSDANPINYYKLNSSYNPLDGVDPLDSPYIVYMGSLNASGWINHVYSPSPNTNYVRGMINNSYIHSLMDTTEIEYLYFTSNTPSSKPYYINITNVVSGTNRTFAETDVLWIGNNAPYTPHPYTPNCWFAFIYNNTSFDYKLYAADNNNQWNDSGLESNMIESGLFPPTTPDINHFFFDNTKIYTINGTYYGIFDVVCALGSDPDGGDVSHNLTLHYANQTFISIINNTFVNGDTFTNVSFDSSSYYSNTEKYQMRIRATDDEGEISESWTCCNFTLNIITNSPTNLQQTHADYWVNWTWDEGTDGNYNVDSYNVSINETWYNTTTNQYYNHTDLNLTENSTIIVYGFNDSSKLSLNYVSGIYTFEDHEENPPIALSLYLTIIVVGLIFTGITFVTNIDPVIKTLTSLISGIIFILSGITMFTTDINTYHNANTYLINTGWIGTLLILIGVVMCLFTILIIYQIFASEKTDLNYKGHG